MNNNSISHLGLSFRIWAMALFFNTVLGTLILALSLGVVLVPEIVWYGLLFGAPVSIPAVGILYLTINRSVAHQISGPVIFRIALLISVVCSLVAWGLYKVFFSGLIDQDILFLLVAIIAGVSATATQQARFYQLAADSATTEEFPI